MTNGFLSSLLKGLGLGLALLSASPSPAGPPLAAAGRQGAVAGSTGVLVDLIYGEPVALLEDPFSRIPANGQSRVFQTEAVTPADSSFPRLRVVDALPEFWAQPSIWRHFTKGPGAASGFGREIGARDWAGRPATDRRAYPLDPGLHSVALAGPNSTPPGVGLITVTYGATGLLLRWNGIVGRAYGLQFTPTLTRPFTSAGLVVGEATGPQIFPLPLAGSAGFYRIVELTP